jgi:hypothetical protein
MPTKPLAEQFIDRLKNRRGIAYAIVAATVIGAIASSAESLSKIVTLVTASVRDGAVPVVLPKDTGWILAGFFDNTIATYTQGPYFKVVRSPYPSTDSVPRQGEWLRLTAERRIVIADFETKGLSRRFDPPWQQNVLKDSDYTGLRLSAGAVVEVRDVSLGAFPEKPAAVWVRVGNPQ